MNTAEALRQLSQHCKQHKCENCELNEVSASTTPRFCLLRKQPSDWPTTGLFRRLQAESEKKGKKTSDCIACALAEECDLKSEQNNEWGEPVWHQEEIEQIKAALAAERGE